MSLASPEDGAGILQLLGDSVSYTEARVRTREGLLLVLVACLAVLAAGQLCSRTHVPASILGSAWWCLCRSCKGVLAASEQPARVLMVLGTCVTFDSRILPKTPVATDRPKDTS